jgi:hypothetical protein
VTGHGELIAERYRLEGRIGHGAMGVVWRAVDERLDRVVAVKQLLAEADDLAGDPGEREGRMAARLRHRHAVMVHDAVEQDGRRYLVMEYFPSRSLAALVAAGGPLAEPEVARIGGQVAAALAAAHGEGIVHRDVKPGNVLVGQDGTAKIADFGISRALGDGTMSSGSILVGTPAYLAPEVATGEHAGFSSDVFALGSTLYAAVEGAPPFGLDDNPIAMLRRVAGGAIAPPRCGDPLAGVLLWMLRRNPGERPVMTEVRDALAAVVAGLPTGAPPPEPVPLPPPPARRTRLAGLLTGAPPGSVSTGAPPPEPVTPPARRTRLRRLAGIGIVAAVLVAVGMLIGTLIPARVVTVVAGPGPSTEPTTTTTTAVPTPRPIGPDRSTNTATVTHEAPAAESGCLASYDITNSWPGGYQAQVTVRSAGPAIAGWTVRFALPAGHAITNLWNGTPTQNGTVVTVTNLSWNANVAAHATTGFGLTATAPPTPDTLTTTLPIATCHPR